MADREDSDEHITPITTVSEITLAYVQGDVRRIKHDMREMRDTAKDSAEEFGRDLDMLDARLAEVEKDNATLFGRHGGRGTLADHDSRITSNSAKIQVLD